jgi:hypothetical protein
MATQVFHYFSVGIFLHFAILKCIMVVLTLIVCFRAVDSAKKVNKTTLFVATCWQAYRTLQAGFFCLGVLASKPLTPI